MMSDDHEHNDHNDQEPGHGVGDPALTLQGGRRSLRSPQLIEGDRRAGALRIGARFLAVVRRRGRRGLRRIGLAGGQGGDQ